MTNNSIEKKNTWDNKMYLSSEILLLLLYYIHAGIGMLLFALFMSARLGIFQETLYSTYGKHPREAMFYSVRSICFNQFKC